MILGTHNMYILLRVTRLLEVAEATQNWPLGF
jgi:hypothetical protein